MSRPSIVLCSRELRPFGGGGIGTYVAAAARTLAPVADVTILTLGRYRERYHELSAVGDPSVDYGRASVAFVPEPQDLGEFYSEIHVYSQHVLERLGELFGARGPDLIEFSDYLGEGFAATQARRGGDRFLEHTQIVVRIHTTDEIGQVLNGYLPQTFDQRATRELERRALRDADVLVHAGGDIRGTYERYYGNPLPPAARIPYPMTWPERVAPAPRHDGPLRLLCVGRMERRKGVQDLIEALTSFTADWRLTLVGADTPTAPHRRSLRRTLELQAAGDPRIAFADAVAREELPALMREHDAVVLPSRWECWPYVALEALAAAVPVVATPVGGLREIVAPGVTGWLAPGVGADALRDVLAPLVADPSRARVERDAGAVRRHLAALADPDAFRAAYLRLAGGRPARVATSRSPDETPLVSVVIPYYRMHRYVEETVRSVFDQTYPRIEVIVVNDGSFEPDDVVLATLARRYPIRVLSQSNRGLSGARNFGIAQTRGRYVLPLDADNVLEPTFVERCVALLEHDDALAYVTSWSRYMAEDGTPYRGGYRPIGNWSTLVEERNVAGDATALLRRGVLHRHCYSEDLTSYEDWALYRELHRAGRHGHVIPEMLWRYRVREDSMLREVGLRHDARLAGEMEALVREKEIEWVSKSD